MAELKDLEERYNVTKSELQEYYNSHNNDDVAKFLGLSKTQTVRIINAFGLEKKVKTIKHIKLSTLASQIDIEQFSVDYSIMTHKDLCDKYNLTVKRVIELRDFLKIDKRKLWKTAAEYEFNKKDLEEFYKEHTLQELVKEFDLGSTATAKKVLKNHGIDVVNRISGYAKDLSKSISKEELSEYYSRHTLKETKDHFGNELVGRLIKYYGISKTKSKESVESVIARINLAEFSRDFEQMNTYELYKKYDISYTMYRKLIKVFNLGYKPGIFAFQDASMSTCEDDLATYISDLIPGHTILRNDRSVLDGREIDIYVPDFRVGFEFNGDYWHSDLKKDKNYHFEKAKAAEGKNIRLIFVWEYEWKDFKTQEKIKQLCRIIFGKLDNKIYARDCTVKLLSNSEAQPFNDATHLQNHRNAQVTYGLFYKDRLVQLMSFSKTAYNKNLTGVNEWEIIRGCPGSNNIVVGGVSKLFTHFIRDYEPNKVFSYCDFNKFNGKSYEALGMKFIGYTGPDMKYKLNDGTVVNRNPKKYKEYNENCKYRLFGAGSKKYEWEKKEK